MNVERHQAVIIGGGLAAAIRLRQKGIDDVVVLEREHRPGGILRQYIHDGFGLTRFGETLSGPEYAQRFVAQAEELGITCLTDTTVLSLEADRTVTASGPAGLKQLRGDAVILTMGCRERTRGAIAIPGDRPAGIFTAGTAQRYINIEGWMVGRRVVILGSGDIGLIMARRMTLEGANVLACVELMPYSNGLNRNIVQCLKDYGIPLYLSHTITNIVGRERVEQVVVSEVGADRRPIPGTEIKFDCDTVLLSVGLIPENELSRQAGVAIDRGSSGASVDETYQTTIPGIFSAGNVLHIHDLVDFVSEEGEGAGKAAAAFVLAGGGACGVGASEQARDVGDVVASARVSAGSGVSYVVPQRVSAQAASKVLMRFRVRRVYKKASIVVLADGAEIKRFKRPVMVPAEMSEIRIDPALIAGRSAIEVRIEGEEE